MKKTTLPQIKRSSNYNEFYFKVGNRKIDTNLKKYRELRESMKKHGWIPSFPATVEIKDGKKFFIDGQNRYTVAKELGLEVIFVVIEVNFKISDIAAPFRPWSGNDFSSSHASEGNRHFQKLEAFRAKHNVSANRAMALLTAKRNVMFDSTGAPSNAIKSGDFEWTDDAADYAEAVLKICDLLPKALRRNRASNAAIGRILLVEKVCRRTLGDKITSNQSKIVPKSSVEEYVQLFEVVYNTRNRSPLPIALMVLEVMRSK